MVLTPRRAPGDMRLEQGAGARGWFGYSGLNLV